MKTIQDKPVIRFYRQEVMDCGAEPHISTMLINNHNIMNINQLANNYYLAVFAQTTSITEKTFPTYLKQIAEGARDLIPDTYSAKVLFDKIRTFNAEGGANPKYKQEHDMVEKYIYLLEYYKDNATKYKYSMPSNLSNVFNAMINNLKMILDAKNFNYVPFKLYIGGQLSPINLDQPQTNELGF